MCPIHRDGRSDEEVSSSTERRCMVHMEGGWDGEGINICRAEVYCPHGGRVGWRGVSIHRDDVSSLLGGRVVSTSTKQRCMVHMEGGA